MGNRRGRGGRRPGRSPRRHHGARTGAGRHRGRRTGRPGGPVRCRCRGRRRPFRPRGDRRRPVGSAVDAARRLRSGARMLRDRHGPVQPRDRGDRSGGDRAVRRSARASRSRGDTAARLSPSRHAPGVVRYRATRGSPTTSSWRASCLPSIESSAPKVAAAVRIWLVSATLGLPGAAHRLRLCDEALAVDPEAEDPWWAQLASGLDFAAVLHLSRGTLADGARPASRVRDQPRTGHGAGRDHWQPVGARRGSGPRRLLALLDGRFQDVTASANRMLEAGARRERPTSRISVSWGWSPSSRAAPRCCCR